MTTSGSRSRTTFASLGVSERRKNHDIPREIAWARAGSHKHTPVARQANDGAGVYPAFERRWHTVRAQVVLQVIRRAIDPDDGFAFEPKLLRTTDHAPIVADREGGTDINERQPDPRRRKAN